MTGILRATLLVALLFSPIPTVAVAQNATVDSLLRRIDRLERTTSDLERRVRELEALITAEPSRAQSVPSSQKWQDVQNWRRLRQGMTMDEVRVFLGEPEKVDVMGSTTYWYWNYPVGAQVYFDSRSGRLQGWSEPRR